MFDGCNAHFFCRCHISVISREFKIMSCCYHFLPPAVPDNNDNIFIEQPLFDDSFEIRVLICLRIEQHGNYASCTHQLCDTTSSRFETVDQGSSRISLRSKWIWLCRDQYVFFFSYNRRLKPKCSTTNVMKDGGERSCEFIIQ